MGFGRSASLHVCADSPLHHSPDGERTANVTDIPATTLDVPSATTSERLALCDYLDGLDGAAWSTQSWCEAWTRTPGGRR